MKKLVLFDFDMTLVDSSYAILYCTNLMAERYGLRQVTHEEMLSVIGFDIERSWLTLWGEFKQEWLDYYRAHFGEKEDLRMRVFENSISTINRLHELGMKVGIASNRRYAMRPLKSLGLDKYPDSVVGLENVENPKPAPDVIVRSLEIHNIAKEAAVYVGDTDIDMQTAKNAGVLAIGMTTGAFSKKQLLTAKADYVCDDLAEIVDILVKE